MACVDFKYLTRKTASDKILSVKAFKIAKNPQYDGYQRGFTSIVYKCFEEKSASLADKPASGSGTKNENISNKGLAEE